MIEKDIEYTVIPPDLPNVRKKDVMH